MEPLIDFLRIIRAEYSIQAEVDQRLINLHHLFAVDKNNHNNIQLPDDWKQLKGLCIRVNKIEDCYMMVGAIHEKWKFMKKYFRDFIANPEKDKKDFLFTVIILDDLTPVPVRIEYSKL